MMKKFLNVVFVRSWWVIGIVLICAILYEQGLMNREELYRQLMEQRFGLQIEKREALDLQQNLQLQINSQNDVESIELTLMRSLGLVPEEQQKVFFYPDNP